MQVYISSERDAITFEMRSLYDSDNKNWFSFDLIGQALGYQAANGLMNEANADFLARNVDELVALFSKENISGTLKKLNDLEAIRAKRM